MVKTDTQPPKKTGIRKTAKNIVDNYPWVSITVLEQPDKSLLGFAEVHWIQKRFSETIIDDLEGILNAVDRLPEIMMFGDKLWEFKREVVVRTALKGAQLRWLEKEFVKALCMNDWWPDYEYLVNMMLLIGFIPWQL